LKTTEWTDQVVVQSGQIDDETPLLSMLVKRTYTLVPGRGCVVAAEQLPFLGLTIDPDEPEAVVTEYDIYPYKPLTDVVVRGHVHAPRKATRMTASVSVGPVTKELLVHGDRTCSRSHTGEIELSPPAEFERMPLSYRNAYGGSDLVALAKYGNPYDEYKVYAPPIAQRSRHTPFRYPRNGIGKGYLCEATDAGLEAVRLPNLEDPSDPLTPARLVVSAPRAWATMPLPWCTDWLSLGAFPRTAYYGPAPPFDLPPDDFAEVRRGLMTKGVLRTSLEPGPAWPRIANAASLGLQLGPYTPADLSSLTFRLENLHPTKKTLTFQLPRGAPEMWVDGRKGDGKLVQAPPVLQQVVIEPDDDRVSVVWRGSVPTLRRYTLEELNRMPLSMSWPEEERAES
jgi:hypothetical protein